MDDKVLRAHLERVPDWEDAHVGFDKAVEGIPEGKRGALAAGFEHSPWQLVEHIRIAQDDILDFCVNAKYAHAMTWPDDYWPAGPEPPSQQAWAKSVGQCVRSREALKQLACEVKDLAATVPTGSGDQTYLRAVLLAADHAAYHVGQLVALRRALGIWPGSQ